MDVIEWLGNYYRELLALAGVLTGAFWTAFKAVTAYRKQEAHGERLTKLEEKLGNTMSEVSVLKQRLGLMETTLDELKELTKLVVTTSSEDRGKTNAILARIEESCANTKEQISVLSERQLKLVEDVAQLKASN